MRRTFHGIFNNGTVNLTEAVPLVGEYDVLVRFLEKKQPPQETWEEFNARFDEISVEMNGWKFNRDEVYEDLL